MYHKVTEVMEYCKPGLKFLIPYYSYIPLNQNLIHNRNIKTVKQFLNEIIQRRREQKQKGNEATSKRGYYY